MNLRPACSKTETRFDSSSQKGLGASHDGTIVLALKNRRWGLPVPRRTKMVHLTTGGRETLVIQWLGFSVFKKGRGKSK